MEQLSQEFIDSCRREGGKIMRGDNMTRIETFVDAAFAFAFTMLVISIDEIPRSPAELIELSKDIPAFVLSAMSIGSVWLAHSSWSRIFGLQDRTTIILSLALVMLVLIFVYPIKLMLQATVIYFGVFTFGIELLDTGLFDNSGWENNQLSELFFFVAIGLMALACIIISLYQNALRYREELRLNQIEQGFCKRTSLTWFVVAATAVASCLLTIYYDDQRMVRAAFVYLTMIITIPLAGKLFEWRSQESGAKEYE